jgi:hypothetical protein
MSTELFLNFLGVRMDSCKAEGFSRQKPLQRLPRYPGSQTSIGENSLLLGVRASCAWVESERDSRISEILIQPVGWAEASRRWQSRIHKTCVTA